MLATLYIENIAVIEKTNIDFSAGLNVLTGETGAGKSIIIDSINAVLGKRSSKEIIRTGAESAFVSAVFEDIDNITEGIVLSLGFNMDDGIIMLQREVNQNGKNSCKVNGRPATVSQLREIGVHLINIHGQHESYELMSPDLHINYIDNFGELTDKLNEYKTAFSHFKSVKKQLDDLNQDEEALAQKIDILKYQIQELTDADIKTGEAESLNEERIILLNSEKTSDTLIQAKICFDGQEEANGIKDLVNSALSALQGSAGYLPDIQNLSSRLYDLYYELEDISNEIDGQIENIENDPQRLEQIEERIDFLNKLSRKYGNTTEEMLEFLENSQKELKQLEQYDTNKSNLKEEYARALNKAKTLAKELSDMRNKASKNFIKKVSSEMAFLDMPKVKIEVEQKTCDLYENGCDKIEFLISTNPGEVPKPVSKIASGGELSRMMLAIKNVLSQSDNVSTLIFDEVDTGISGSAAHKVGLKLKEVSQTSQVLCVTHQAQIAALADTHYLIKKQFKNNKTYTDVFELDYEGRKSELARIIGGVDIDDAALAFAQKLLDSNTQNK